MESKFQLSLKDAIYIISLVCTVFGAWFSLSFKVTEAEIRAQAKMEVMQAKVAVLETTVAELKTALNQVNERKNSRK